MKNILIAVLLTLLPLTANAQQLLPSPTQHQAFNDEQAKQTGSNDVAYNIAYDTTEQFSIADNKDKPGFGIGPYINDPQLLQTIVAQHNFSFTALMVIGVRVHYTFLF